MEKKKGSILGGGEGTFVCIEVVLVLWAPTSESHDLVGIDSSEQCPQTRRRGLTPSNSSRSFWNPVLARL